MSIQDEDEEDDDSEQVKQNFLTLSNEIRVDIIQFLQENGPSTFTGLKKGIGIFDNGQLNYHLDKLLGRFVKKVEHEGDTLYSVKYGSEMVVKSMMSTVPASEEVPEKIEMDYKCVDCGDGLVAIYDDEVLKIKCENEGLLKAAYPFPPKAFEGRTDEEVLNAFNTMTSLYRDFTRRGVCPLCLGKIETEFITDLPEGNIEDSYNHLFQMKCQICGFDMAAEADWFLHNHPKIVDIHREHGIEIRETPFWELSIENSENNEIVSEDPVRVKFEFEIDEVIYQVFVDRDLDIVEIEKE